MSDRPYARFYYGDFKRDYPDCYADPAVLGTFVQLLSLAEATWPALPDLPRGVRSKPLAVLIDRGLVVVTGLSYVIKGHAAERTRRADAARVGGLASGRSRAVEHSLNGRSTDDEPRRVREETRRALPRARNSVDKSPLLSEMRAEYRKAYEGEVG